MYIHVPVELVAILSYCLHLKDVSERKSLLATLISTVNSLKSSKDTTETESEEAENSSWDQANIKQKTCQIVNDYLSFPFFLLIILCPIYSPCRNKVVAQASGGRHLVLSGS
jgi:hypothetical protein